MNKDNAHLYLPFVQALADGKTVQMADNVIDGEGEGWEGWDSSVTNINFTEPPEYYRIKPEPIRFWINVYDKFVAAHDTEENALNSKGSGCTRTVKAVEVINETET